MGEPGRAKAQKRTITMLSRVLGPGLVIFRGVRCSTGDCGRYKPLSIAFVLEGLPLDRCVTLNYGIRVQLLPVFSLAARTPKNSRRHEDVTSVEKSAPATWQLVAS
jgi:hypothetical protein